MNKNKSTENQLHYLNRKWNLWYHDPNNNCYTLESYLNLGCIETIEAFWQYYYQIKALQIQNGMFFLMLEGVKPTWEDNLEGGSWSYKIDKKDISQAWTKLSIFLLADNFINQNLDSNLNKEIVGISISPKKTFSIFKLWINNHNLKDEIKFNTELPFLKDDEALYRSHLEIKIKEDQIHFLEKNVVKTLF